MDTIFNNDIGSDNSERRRGRDGVSTASTASNDGSDVEDNKELHGSGVINYRTGIVFLAADMHDPLVGRSPSRQPPARSHLRL